MKPNTPSDQAKIAALRESFEHLRYVMGARLWFTNIHAVVMAFLFRHLLEGDLWVIIFGYLISFIGSMYVIRESNAADNYEGKIKKLRDELGMQDYLSLHLDKEYPDWKWKFLRVRMAFTLYYSGVFTVITEFFLRGRSICNCLHIAILIVVFVALFLSVRHFSSIIERKQREEEKSKNKDEHPSSL